MLTACSVNPATGEKQFTALMSPQSELTTGGQEHEKIIRTYGEKYEGTPLQAYVNSVGARVVKNTERKDVQYKFYVLDTPDINAFALPGGYIYVTRGLLALVNSEAELAGVLAHEVGHIAARHSAERYSRGVLTSIGAAALAVALDSSDASQALGLGSQLYTMKYSRDQETEADMLGVRYLAKAGYDPQAIARFLEDMDRSEKLDSQLAGIANKGEFDFFSTHPQTADRVANAAAEAAKYSNGAAAQGVDTYLTQVNGLIYGDSPEQGLVRENSFYHPGLNLAFTVPAGFTLANTSHEVVARGPDGSVAVFDGAPNTKSADAMTYLTRDWLNGEKAGMPETLVIGGKQAASVAFDSKVNGRNMKIRLIAVPWAADKFFRFQIAMPKDAPAKLVDDLKQMTYSLRPMSDAERQTIHPYRIEIVTAKDGDNAASISGRSVLKTATTERFQALNGLKDGSVTAGRQYKLVVE
jgi:predicted Zn-dependent protease